jgi:hypothetical protein
MPTPSLPISSALPSGRVLGFGVQIADRTFYFEPINLSIIGLAKNLDGFQLYADKCLRSVEARYSLEATLNTDNTPNQIMVAPQEHGDENHTYTSALKCCTTSQYDTIVPPMPTQNQTLPSSNEFGDARLHGEIKKVQDDSSLFFTSTSLHEFENSILNDKLPYNLTSEAIVFPVEPPMSNIFNTSPIIQERNPSIENWTSLSHASPTSQICPPSSLRAHTTLCRHHCPWAGCASNFRRAADRDRHFVTIHGKPVKHFCPVAGCSRGCGLWRGYSREDKVKEHVKKVHVSGKL